MIEDYHHLYDPICVPWLLEIAYVPNFLFDEYVSVYLHIII